MLTPLGTSCVYITYIYYPVNALSQAKINDKWLKKIVNFDMVCFPKAVLLFGLFSDFRCGVPLFIVILVIYKYKNR